MKRDLHALADGVFDAVVIGGGIFGVCTAYDMAQRGLRVALVERDDFAGATSANSLKMVHGGIRYIQHMDVARIRHSAAERRAFLRVAPHLVRPLPIVIPTYGHGMKGKEVLRIGMGLFDLLTLDCNRGIKDRTRRIPWCRTIGRDRALRMYPGLSSDGLTGASVFCDGQMFNPTRLVFAFLQNAVDEGAVVANHIECTGFLREGDKVTGIKARDTIGDEELEVRAKLVVNAAGPYAEKLLGIENTKLDQKISYSRDTAFVVNRKLTADDHAIAIQGTTNDPDAKLSRGARHMFVAPWRDKTLVGVWHGVHQSDPDSFTVTDAELERYIDEMNQIYPAWGLTMDDISIWNAGLVPFGDNPDGASHLEGEDLKYGHRSHLIDHAQTHGIDNLITLIGVRYTTGRYEAQKTTDLALKKLGTTATRCRTAEVPVAGGDIANYDALVTQAKRAAPEGLDGEVIRSLVANYGTGYRAIFDRIEADPRLAEPIGSSKTIQAQAVHAVDREMAKTLSDIVFRRTDLATGEYPGTAALWRCASELADTLDWTEAEIERQVQRVAGRFPAAAVRRVDASTTASSEAETDAA